MARPTILTVDDDELVSQALARDLRERYGADYRVVRATSGDAALEVLAKLALQDRPVALVVTDQRMPRMTGIELLERARGVVPGREVPAAHGVRRHRGRDPGDQRDRPRLLPAQAVGPARPAALPRRRRPARRLARGEPRGHHRRARGRAPLVGPQPRGEDVPGPQPRALPLARRRARRGGAAAGRALRRRRRRAAAGAGARRRAAALPHQPRPRRRARAAHHARAAAVRRVHRRRRAGRAGGRGVRRVGGPAHGGGRARGARRAGRAERGDRELPRLPQGAQRRRPHPAGDRAGLAVRRRDGAGPRRGRLRGARARCGRCCSPAAATSRRGR